MEPLPESATPGWPFPFTPQDWEQTPPAVQAYLRTVGDALGQLQERVDTLEARLQQNSTTSHRPPSSDSPYKKPRQRPIHHHTPESGRETGPSGPAPGACTSHDAPGTAARGVCVWQHASCPDHAVPHPSGA